MPVRYKGVKNVQCIEKEKNDITDFVENILFKLKSGDKKRIKAYQKIFEATDELEEIRKEEKEQRRKEQ